MDDASKQERIVYEEKTVCPNCSVTNKIELTTEHDETTQIVFCGNCGIDYAVRVSFFIELQVCALKPVRTKRAARA